MNEGNNEISLDKSYIYILGVISLLLFLYIFYYCVNYELSHAYTADAPMYWAVGRGMLNGILPYSGLYENKPLGIFLISMISFLLTDDTILCNIFSILSILVIVLVPTISVINICKNKEINYEDKSILLIIIITFLGSLLLLTYSEERSGAFQVEQIGAAFSLLFIWSVIRLKNVTNKKEKIISICFSALFIMISVMMKEPFLFVSVAGCLLFIDSFKEFLSYLMLPLCIGGLMYFLVLFVTGTIKPYFEIYFMYMLNSKLGGSDSAFSRILNLDIIYDDFNYFDELFIIILLFLILTFLGFLWYKKKLTKIYHVIRVVLAVVIASFCVGMGGQYYNHHFVFALPIYSTFIIYGSSLLSNYIKYRGFVNIFMFTFALVLLIVNGAQCHRTYAGDYTERYNLIVNKAKYVDELLDFYGEERYQFIGFNGEDEFYGLTKHSPKGPVFVQDADNFLEDDTWFAKSFLQQLNESNIVIFKEINMPSIEKEVMDILCNDFSDTPPYDFYDAPLDFNYIIYYRNNYFN